MPRPSAPLYLQEELLLLGLKDREGTPQTLGTYEYALGAALAAELLASGRVALAGEKKKRLELRDARPLGEPLLDECLTKIAAARRAADLAAWVRRFSALKGLRRRVALGLCERGILRADEDTVLLLFRRRIYPELDPRAERAIVERLRRALFTETRDVDARTIILLALADSLGLLAAIFGKAELKERKARLRELTAGEAFGQIARELLQAARAAVAAAATAGRH